MLVGALWLAEAQIGVGTNLRLNDPNGPDGDPNTLDDEPRRHIEPAIAVHPVEPGNLLAAWIDWRYPVEVGEEPIVVDTNGFNVFDMATSPPWTNHEVIWGNPNIERLHGYEWRLSHADPGTAIGGNGNRYMVALDSGDYPNRLIFLRSTDADPNSWKLVRFFSDDPNQLCPELGPADKPLVTADPTPALVDPVRAQRVFVHWSQNVPSLVGFEVRFVRDEEGGDRILGLPLPRLPVGRCETEMIAATNDADPPEPPVKHSLKFGATSAVGPDGEDHVAWLDMRDPNDPADGDIRYRKLIPPAGPGQPWTWEPPIGPEPEDYEESRLVAAIDESAAGPTFLATNIQLGRLHSLPSIAVDWSYGGTCANRRGWVYIVYAAEDTSAGWLADIFCVRSRDNGETWDPPVKVNDDQTNAVQIMPWVVVDHVGRVIVMWVDFREDAADNRKYLIYMAVSLDGGFTFTQNKRVTEDGDPPQPVFSDTDFQTGTVFIGDYNYMAVEPDPNDPTGQASRAFPIWADLRNRDLPGTTHQTAGDIYYASATVTGDVFAVPDFDDDGDIDLADFQTFQLCYSGSGNPHPPGCERADFDVDGDVDLADFTLFQLCFNGSGSESGASGPDPETLPAMAQWCEQNLNSDQRQRFAGVLRDAVRRRPTASDARLNTELADAIWPQP